eukprot:TRINITY_DN102480_c0_g1_i1.p1 TRINITY_DN102480_c0_g1~~TRINITY_DN102480_c0_g1_i1.p1  ORF type:complete len:292 (+),score=45.09 TRINITY_DN102480_c0_g1_i1:79-954(+)
MTKTAWATPRPAPQAFQPVHGDETRRIEVPLPRSLPELKLAATKHFGNNSTRMKMHKGGVAAVTSQAHVQNLKDEDVIVISFAGAQAPTNLEVPTYKADYVKYPLSSSRAGAKTPLVSDPVPFEGMSSYTIDYPPRATSSANVRRHPERPSSVQERFTGTTTYCDHYARHNVESYHRAATPGASRPGALPPPAFEGVTSHMIDFLKYTTEVPARFQPHDKAMPERPFEAETTYDAHFPARHAERTPRRRKVRMGPTMSSPPFRGVSEYKTVYQGKSLHKPERIYLMPQANY